MSSLQKFHRRTQPFKVNALHTGTVSISGTATVGSVLTATNNIADVDGLGTFAYQWNRSGSAISGETATTYTLVSADTGNTITVSITYTDGKGFIETETSAATASVVAMWPPSAIGAGDATHGFWLGTAGDGTSKLIVAPKSTEVTGYSWGSKGTLRAATSLTDGISNTNLLLSFGTSAHPAAAYCKYLSTGGYNTWYLPAINELITIYSNHNATPFATANGVIGNYTLSSNQYYGGATNSSLWPNYAGGVDLANGYSGPALKDGGGYKIRATRRTIL